jgi:hypothetical protein
VQVDNNQIAIDASVVDPPVLPVLADHLFPHTAASVATPKMYSTTVTLPMQSCAKCTLQVIQFMADHGPNPSNTMSGAYIYHHCADISIADGAGTGATTGSTTGGASTTAGATTGAGGSTSAGSTSDSGCGCSIPGRSKSSPATLGALLACAWAARRIRRRRR